MYWQQERPRQRSIVVTKALHLFCATTTVLLLSTSASAFAPNNCVRSRNSRAPLPQQVPQVLIKNNNRNKRYTDFLSTELNVWFFGGSDTETNEDSCELVAVRIERTSPNSRRIAGEITIPKPIDDVWAILTDYDNLAIHVPNLVESRRVNPKYTNPGSVQGDGEYQCRLFQRGAQKIVGFEFGASVTMDMSESIVSASSNRERRVINFKCVESQFFNEFDGQWVATWVPDPDNPSELITKVRYTVDVRPRGPVPVQALEWRIENDVPTNLRAVKAASIEVGKDGVLALRDELRTRRNGSVIPPNRATATSSLKLTPQSRRTSIERRSGRIATVASNTRKNMGALVNQAKDTVVNATKPLPQTKLAPVRVDWYDDETMAAYLDKRRR